MSKLGILGATALSLTLAVATPALAAERGGGGGAMRGGGGGGMHYSGGGGMHSGGGAAFHGAASPGSANPAFRGAQASIAAGPTVGGGNFARGGAQFAQGGYQGGFRGDGFRGDRDRDHRFGRGLGFAAGLAAGSALGYDYYDSYYPSYYDDYAYNDYYDGGYADGYVVSSPVYESAVVGAAGDPTYCAQRYRSYDPATGTYLGYDGLRHPCE